ncbi:MAG: hypothetical protein IKE68_00745, partial [Solobacterium sp.]|nr:hypothetical protein [Solobacterium sp.]
MAKRRRRRKTRIRYGRVVILVLLALAAGNLVWTVLSELTRPAEPAVPTPTPDPRYVNHYNWENLTADGQYRAYSDDTYTSMQGIDVSYAQGELDAVIPDCLPVDLALRIGNIDSLPGNICLIIVCFVLPIRVEIGPVVIIQIPRIRCRGRHRRFGRPGQLTQ